MRMRRAFTAFLVGALSAVALPADPGQEAMQRAMAAAGRLSEEGNRLAAELAKRVAASPGRFDLAIYDRLNREALAGLEVASPRLRPTLEGRRLASDAGAPSDIVAYRLELSGEGPFSALHTYLSRLSHSLGGGRAQLESLRLEALGERQVRLTALYSLPHLEPAADESPTSGNLADVIQWLEAGNARRKLSIQLLDELAASSRTRELADALAALGRAAGVGGELAITKIAADFVSVRLEGVANSEADRNRIEELLAKAGFYGVQMTFPSGADPCPPFTANLRLSRVEKTEPLPDADRLFLSADELCRPVASAPAPPPGEKP